MKGTLPQPIEALLWDCVVTQRELRADIPTQLLNSILATVAVRSALE